MIVKYEKLLIIETFVLNFSLSSDKLGSGTGEFTIEVEFESSEDDDNKKQFAPFDFNGNFNVDDVFAEQ